MTISEKWEVINSDEVISELLEKCEPGSSLSPWFGIPKVKGWAPKEYANEELILGFNHNGVDVIAGIKYKPKVNAVKGRRFFNTEHDFSLGSVMPRIIELSGKKLDDVAFWMGIEADHLKEIIYGFCPVPKGFCQAIVRYAKTNLSEDLMTDLLQSVYKSDPYQP